MAAALHHARPVLRPGLDVHPDPAGRRRRDSATFMLFVMLLVVAVSSMLASSLPVAVFAATVPVTAAVALNFVLQGHGARLHPGGDGDHRAGLFRAAGPPALLDHAGDIEARAEKDALIGELEQAKANSDEARTPRRSRQHRQVALPRADEPRVAHAAQRHSRLLRSDEERNFRRASVPAYKEYAGDIHNSGVHLLGLINEILDLSRVEAGRYELNEEAISLAAMRRRMPPSAEAARQKPRHHDPRNVRARYAAAVGRRARGAADLPQSACPTRSSSRRRAARSGSRSAGPRRAANT